MENKFDLVLCEAERRGYKNVNATTFSLYSFFIINDGLIYKDNTVTCKKMNYIKEYNDEDLITHLYDYITSKEYNTYFNINSESFSLEVERGNSSNCEVEKNNRNYSNEIHYIVNRMQPLTGKIYGAFLSSDITSLVELLLDILFDEKFMYKVHYHSDGDNFSVFDTLNNNIVFTSSKSDESILMGIFNFVASDAFNEHLQKIKYLYYIYEQLSEIGYSRNDFGKLLLELKHLSKPFTLIKIYDNIGFYFNHNKNGYKIFIPAYRKDGSSMGKYTHVLDVEESFNVRIELLYHFFESPLYNSIIRNHILANEFYKC